MVDTSLWLGGAHGSRSVHALWHAGVWAVIHRQDCYGELDDMYDVIHIPSGCSIGGHTGREELAISRLDVLARECGQWGADLTFATTRVPGNAPKDALVAAGLWR